MVGSRCDSMAHDQYFVAAFAVARTKDVGKVTFRPCNRHGSVVAASELHIQSQNSTWGRPAMQIVHG